MAADDHEAAARRVRALYEANPYPARSAQGKHEGAPLPPIAWINAIARPGRPVVGPGTRVLVAGCGTGVEAHRYALAAPEAEVVGVDFSAPSIEVAREILRQQGHARLRFEVADLSTDTIADRFGRFDFISLHGVADYIPDVGAALRALSRALVSDGCLYAGVNGPGHPSVRYKRAFAAMGLSIDQRTVGEDDRARLRAIEALMGSEGRGCSTASEIYIASDIFAGVNHCLPIGLWLDLASAAGLHLLTSLDPVAIVPGVDPAALRHLLPHSRAALSRLSCEVQEKSFMRLLFLGSPPAEPPWTDLDALGDWRPLLDPAARAGLPATTARADRSVAVSFIAPGIGASRVVMPESVVEYLRECDGRRTAIEVWAGLPEQIDWDEIRAGLFRLFHLGVARMWNGTSPKIA